MAQAQTFRFGKAMVLLGDSATLNEEFAAPCGVEELTMTINIETNSVNVPDCEDPDLASWLVSDEVSRQMVIAGNGVLDMKAQQAWQDWWMDGGEKNVRLFKDLSAANGGGYYQAPAVLSAYEETASRGQRWRNSFTITLNGKPAFTPAA